MSLVMPPPDQEILGRRGEIATAMRRIVPMESVDDTAALKAYESDGLTAYRQPPLVVVLPETTSQVSDILRWCHDAGVKVVPRGAGTSLSGGALPLADGVLLGLARMNHILDVDYIDRVAVVQPGRDQPCSHPGSCSGWFLLRARSVESDRLHDRREHRRKSGGVHCLKYGLTTNNVLGVETVLADGEIVRFGGRHLEPAGLDLLGLIVGSEGLLGVVTEVTVRTFLRLRPRVRSCSVSPPQPPPASASPRSSGKASFPPAWR
jgi:glycolate oxidase